MMEERELARALGNVEGGLNALKITVIDGFKEVKELYGGVLGKHESLAKDFNSLQGDFNQLYKEHESHIAQCSPVVVQTGNPAQVSLEKVRITDIVSVKNLGYMIAGALLAFGAVAVAAVLVALKVAKVF